MKKIFGYLSPRKSALGVLLGILALLPTSIHAANIAGVVRSSADTSIHIVGAKVVLIVANARIDSTVTDSVGNYLLDSIAVGNGKSLQVTKTGFAPTTSANFNITTAQANATITQNINMLLYGTISGTVRKSSDSTAIAGAKVVLRRGTSTTALDSVVTNSLGIFNFTNLAPGTPNYSVTVTVVGYLEFTGANVAVTSGGSASLNAYLVTAIPATITGLVRKLADTTFRIANAKVVLRRSSATSAVIDSAVSDSVGRYTFTNVAPGTPNYWISATATGYISTSNNNVAVGNGLTVTSNLGLGSPGTITGTLTNAVSPEIIVPISGARVLLRRGSDSATVIDSTTSNSQGVYSFFNVAPGTPNYWITAITNIGTKTNANVVGSSGGTTVSNFAFVQTVSLYPSISNSHGVRFVRLGNHLILNLQPSISAQVVEVYGINGAVYHRMTVPAGETHVLVPVSAAMGNNFLIRLK